MDQKAGQVQVGRKSLKPLWMMILPFLVLVVMTLEQAWHQVWAWDTAWMWDLHDDASPMRDRLAIALAYAGGLPGTLTICGLVSLALIGCRHWAVARAQLELLWLSILGASSLSWLLKYAIERPRPGLWPLIAPEYGASFPSGHSVYAATLAAVLIVWGTGQGRGMRWLTIVVGMSWMGAMGVSRVYLGAHYPTDVMAGWALGVCWVALVAWVYKREVRIYG